MESSFRVEGRIEVTGRSAASVHGLCVQVWQKTQCEAHLLGEDLTNSDGRYVVCFDPDALVDASAHAPKVFLTVKDCDCRVLYDSRDQSCACPAGVPTTLDVELAEEVLWWHRQCGSWSRPEDPLLEAKVLDEIEEALELLDPKGASRRSPVSECLRSATPLIACFDHALRDAWQTLRGDLDAARRYRDILDRLCAEHLCAEQQSDCGCSGSSAFSELVDATFEELWRPDEPATGCCEDGGSCSCAEPDPASCPCRPRTLEHDKSIVLLMAAVHLACGHVPTAKRYLLTLLEELCRFDQLGALHRAAVGASCGDSAELQHFRDLLEALVKRCDASPCCCATCLDPELAECLRDVVRVWSHIDCYRVAAIQPARACPGDQLEICGTGLGKTSGHVLFGRKGGPGLGPITQPDVWSDGRLVVEVPERAGCGLMPLLPAQTVRVCGRFLELRPTGCLDAEFEGTSAEILKFAVKNHANDSCLRPGEVLQIRWKVCAADSVRVEIVNRQTGGVIAAQDPADERGCWDFEGTDFKETTEVTVRIVVRGQCQPAQSSREIHFVFQNPPDLSVDGLEVTQAIQHYRASEHLTDPADRGPDNSLRLVTNKTAWVRVYLRSGQSPGFDGGDLRNVTGTLRVERRVGGVWSTVATLAPQNGPVDARDAFVSYDAERGNIDATLNFVVPANVMTGLLRFRADVESPYRDCPGNTASGQTTVDVNLTQTLNAAFITIGYNGPNDDASANLNLPAPTLAQCQAETAWAMKTFPVSGAPNVRIAGSFVTNTPLNDMRSCPGCCSPNWGPLLTQIALFTLADQIASPGGNWVYYGIINNGIPVNVPGCNGVATGGLAGRPGTYAHEIGHLFGLPHSRCGNAGAGNANYPVYEPYDLPVDVPANPINSTNWTMASIGEYGLDIDSGAIANPNSAEDFMSYCGPRWIGKFTHGFLVNRPRLSPQVIATGSGAAGARVITDDEPGFERDVDEIRPLIDLLGTFDADSPQVASVARVESSFLAAAGRRSDLTAQLLLGEDVITADAVYVFGDEGQCGGASGDSCCDDCADEPKPTAFRAMLDDRAHGDCLRIVDAEGKTLWERACPAQDPQLSRVTATLDEKKGAVKVSWRLSCADRDEASVWIRWSDDDGKTWRALAVGVAGASASFATEVLPAGTVKFQVMAHDGFSTVTAETQALELAARPPSVTIFHPTPKARVYCERQLRLAGVAGTVDGRAIDDDAYLWTLDDEPVARGRDVWVDCPDPGSHEVRLEVTLDGLTGAATTRFAVE